jgi:type I restriction enzyme, S subunit
VQLNETLKKPVNTGETTIPSNWKWVTLDEISKKITDGSHNPPKGIESGIPMLSARNIQNNSIDFSNVRYLSDEDYEAENQRTSLEPQDILLTTVGTIGRVALVPNDNFKFVLQRSVTVIKSLINPKYVLYYIQSSDFQKKLLDNSSGTAQKGIYLNVLRTLKIPLAPDEEQDRVVGKIEELFSELDSILNILNELNYKIKVYWYSELSSFLKGKKTKRLNAESVEKILFKIKEQRLEQKINYHGESDFIKDPNIKIPDNWKLVKLSDVFINPSNSISDGPFGSNLKSSDFQSTGFPILKIQNIDRNSFISKDISYVSEEKLNDLKKHQFNSGDIVITKLGSPLGKACIVPKNFQLGVIVADLIRIKFNEFINSKFLMYSLNSPYMISQIEKLSKGTTRQRVTLSDIRNLLLIFPNLREQEDIVNKIEALDDELRNLTSFITRTILEVEALKQKILNDAYNANLVFNVKKDNSLEEYLLNIKIEKEKHIILQKEKSKLIPKVKKMKIDLDLEEILKSKNEPIKSFDLWQESNYKDNIEEFYKRLKELDTKIKEIKDGHLSYIELVK